MTLRHSVSCRCPTSGHTRHCARCWSALPNLWESQREAEGYQWLPVQPLHLCQPFQFSLGSWISATYAHQELGLLPAALHGVHPPAHLCLWPRDRPVLLPPGYPPCHMRLFSVVGRLLGARYGPPLSQSSPCWGPACREALCASQARTRVLVQAVPDFSSGNPVDLWKQMEQMGYPGARGQTMGFLSLALTWIF